MSRRSYSVTWTDEARADLAAIVDYFTDQSPAHALDLMEKLEAVGASLELSPARCRIVPEALKTGERAYREALVAPYRIIFQLDDDTVAILAVLDGRRDLREELFYRLRVRG